MTNIATVTLAVLGESAKSGLGIPSTLVLVSLYEAGGEAPMSDLYGMIAVHGSNVRRSAYTLEDAKLVTRKSIDGTRVRNGVPSKLKLTAKGRKLAERITKAAEAAAVA